MVGAVGFLYAIACLNASNLMLVRMLGQQRELSIRLALGAGRWRIVRQLLLESATLAVVASLLGAIVANWFFPLLLSAAGGSGSTPDWKTWTLGTRTVVLLGGLTLVTSLLIALVPVLRILRVEIYSGMKEGGAALGESVGVARLRSGLVVVQAAFAVILLSGAGLMIQTFHNLQKVELGFDPAGRAKVQVVLPAGEYTKEGDWEPALAKLRSIQAELQRVPGVTAVGFGNDLLLPGYYYAGQTVEGPEGKPVKAAMMGFNVGYHEASGLRLKRGRWLNQSRGNEVLVNESFARSCWPEKDPIGQFVRPTNANPSQGAKWQGWVVAGVVGDVRSTMREAPNNFIYCPEGWGTANFTTFIVKSSRDYDEALAALLRRQLYAFDSRLVVPQIISLTAVRDQQLWAERMANSVLTVLAGIALLLTGVGIFSVLAYTVDRRMGEFGVRMALGATRGGLIRLIMRRGVLLTLAGVVGGVAGALALTQSLRTLLFEVSPQSPGVLALVAAILLLASILGCIVPALRATKVDITKLLRSDS
jgi:predicted permease